MSATLATGPDTLMSGVRVADLGPFRTDGGQPPGGILGAVVDGVELADDLSGEVIG